MLGAMVKAWAFQRESASLSLESTLCAKSQMLFPYYCCLFWNNFMWLIWV